MTNPAEAYVPVIEGTAPAQRAAAVTKSDTTHVGCRFLYVGGTGDVAVIPVGQTTAVTIPSVPAGMILWVACDKIMSTNTTATSMVAFF